MKHLLAALALIPLGCINQLPLDLRVDMSGEVPIFEVADVERLSSIQVYRCQDCVADAVEYEAVVDDLVGYWTTKDRNYNPLIPSRVVWGELPEGDDIHRYETYTPDAASLDGDYFVVATWLRITPICTGSAGEGRAMFTWPPQQAREQDVPPDLRYGPADELRARISRSGGRQP